MIGTNVRGLRHLWRLSDSSLKEVMIHLKDHGCCFCHVFKSKPDSIVGERMFILNPHINYGSSMSVSSILSSKMLTEKEINYVASHYSRVMEFDKSFHFEKDFPFIYSITLLPDNFEEKYAKFLSDNAKMIRTLTGKYGYGTNQDMSKRAYMYSDGSKNFYQWAIANYFQNGLSMYSIRNIMLWNESYGQLAKNLKKNTITAYTSIDDIMSLSEELRQLRRDKRINDAVNMFNTTQKRILRNAEFTEKDKETLSKFFRLSDTKKVNFVRKMSTIEDYDEIMRQMRHLTSIHFDWNKESFMDFISNVEGLNYETIIDNGDVVLVRVNDYETVKNLAKTTNWCISKNKTYWNQYVEHRDDSVQYVVFDFSKKEDDLLSIIGFTTEYNKGITHAHDFTNNDIMKKDDSIGNREFLNSFVSKFSSNDGIYNVLKNCGIDINLVAQYDKPLFQWNKESMFQYLYECVGKGNVDVLVDNDNKVAISVKDSGIRFFLGDAYIDNVGSDCWGWQHIIFMDFSLSEYDPNRIVFAVIRNQNNNSEDYCYCIYNEHIEGNNLSFDAKLCQYGLPYDIIRRADNKNARISSAMLSYNAPMFKELIAGMDKKKLRAVIDGYIGEETAINRITTSVIDSMSFDLVDAFLCNGYRLTDAFDTGFIASFLRDVVSNMINHGHMGAMDGSYKIPTSEEIDTFMAGNCDSVDKAFYIGSYLVLKKVISSEKGSNKNHNALYRRIAAVILTCRKSGEILDELMMDVAGQINFDSTQNDIVTTWVSFANTRGGEKLRQYTIDNLLEKHPLVKQVWNDIEERKRNSTSHHLEDGSRHFVTHPFNDLRGQEQGYGAPPEWEFVDDMFADRDVEDEFEEDGEYIDDEAEEPAEAVF